MRSNRPVQILVICVLLLTLSAPLFGQKKKEVVKIEGTVVAENIFDTLQACYHVCGFRLLVRLDGDKTPEFVFISVAFMDDRHLKDKGPHWKLVEKSSRWKFEALPNDPPMMLLEQFETGYKTETEKEVSETIRIDQWRPLPGSEDVTLPFGQKIPSYFVDVGKFTPITRHKD